MVRTNGSQLSTADIQGLKDAIRGEVLVKGETPEAEYTEAIKRWNMMHVKQAHLIVMVETESDVQETVKFCRKFDIDFCISAGRHTYSGPSSCEGLVIDLRKLNSVEIDSENKIATVGGGCIAEKVERAAHAKGFRAVFGAVNETGVGGITTGGGIGFLSGQYGLVCDQVVTARVVLADGSVAVANEKENPDLFFGIRGAGSNFGIVTQFTYKIYEDRGECYHAMIMFSPDKRDDCFSLVNWIYHEAVLPSNGLLQPVLLLSRIPGAGWCPIFMTFYDGPEEKAKEILKPLFDLGPMQVKGGMVPYPDVTDMKKHAALFPPQYNRIGASSTQLSYPLDVDILHATANAFVEVVDRHGSHAYVSKWLLDLRDYRKVGDVPVGATAYANRTPGALLAPDFLWDDASLDEVMIKEARSISALCRKMLKERKAKNVLTLTPEAQVMPSGEEIAEVAKNDDDEESGEHIAATTLYALVSDGKEKLMSVYGKNLPRLRQVKAKYDPEVVFDKWYTIEPALAN